MRSMRGSAAGTVWPWSISLRDFRRSFGSRRVRGRMGCGLYECMGVGVRELGREWARIWMGGEISVVRFGEAGAWGVGAVEACPPSPVAVVGDGVRGAGECEHGTRR